MNLNAQSICLWLAAFFGAVLLAAFALFPGFLPPMSPGASAHEVASFYAHHKTMIRVSMITFDFCGVMLMPLFMVIIHQMKRIATSTDVFAYGYMSAALSGVTLFALADLFWLIAAFRPERDAQLLVLLNDFAWITFTAPVGTFVAQNVCLALAVYLDKGPTPVFPRWVAHFNLVTAALIAPAACASVFKSGPLAWDGAISFWLRLGTFGVYMATMFFVLRVAVRQEMAEPAGDPSGAPVLVPA